LPSIDAVTAASGYSGRIAVRYLLIVVDELCVAASAASHDGICMNLHHQYSVKRAKCRAVDRQHLEGDPRSGASEDIRAVEQLAEEPTARGFGFLMLRLSRTPNQRVGRT
jgi:hypothetical protein